MKNFLSISCMILFLFLSLSLFALSDGILIDDFKAGLSPKWEVKSFKGETSYQVTREDNRDCLMAASSASASGLFYKIDYDPEDYPILSWEWKIEHVLKKGNALIKEGDDYAARIYVVFPSILFWKTRAINYIWANTLPLGETIPNSFTSNAVMIAVESGQINAGHWREENRNIYQDYILAFGKEPPKVGAVAIMTDTDNTGEEAVAWYGPIRVLPGSD